MRKDYNILSARIQERLNPDSDPIIKAFTNESLIDYKDVYRFVKLSMKAVDQKYTARSIEAGNNVKDHLIKEDLKASYEFQGSVMTDTHIKGHSDIDLLVISSKFYTWAKGEVNAILESPILMQRYSHPALVKLKNEVNTSNIYQNSLQDLLELRMKSQAKMIATYEICDVSKAKAIKIMNKNLNREVDIVIACWYEGVSSIITKAKKDKGVKIYNLDKQMTGDKSFPFLSIERINGRNTVTNGRLKKMIRFVKNCLINYQTTLNIELDLKSFQINAICYNINPDIYHDLVFHELVAVVYHEIQRITQDSVYANTIKSVDGTETIFKDSVTLMGDLKLVLNEIESIHFDIQETQLIAS